MATPPFLDKTRGHCAALSEQQPEQLTAVELKEQAVLLLNDQECLYQTAACADLGPVQYLSHGAHERLSE